MSSSSSEKRKVRLLAGAGTLSLLLVGTFMAFGGTNAVGLISAAGDPNSVTTVDDIQSENASLREVIETMQTNETQYREQIESANDIITQLQSDLTTTTESYDGVLAEYDQSLLGLQQQNSELVSQLTELQVRDAAYAADLEAANSLLTERDGSLDALSARETEFLAALEQANGSITLLQTELNGSQQSLVALNSQNAQLQELVALMQAREQEYINQINSINNAQAASAGSGYGGGGEYEGEEEGEEYEEEEEEEYDD